MTKILILYTGGTIGMGPEDPRNSNSPLIPLGWEFLQKSMPSLSQDGYFTREKGITFSYISFETILDSSEFTPAHWSRISELIFENYTKYDGFIIIHGTDTMAYTASALSFTLQNLNKPVVITGSQLPIFHPRTDAVNNLSNAIHIAAAEAFNLVSIPEVLICFNDTLLRGNRSTKSSSKDFSGFEAPSFPALGNFNESIKIWNKYQPVLSAGPFHILPEFETNIMTITIFPGFNPDIFHRLADDELIKGVILRTYGSGNAPGNHPFISGLKKMIDMGKKVLNISQCLEGYVNMNKYKTGNSLFECGVLGGSDMTLESATAKLMWVIRNVEIEQQNASLKGNLKGELTES